MKRLRDIFMVLTLALVAMTLGGCTHNNGDIGPWFGAWRVESITVDGEPRADYAPPYLIWKFQGNVTLIQVPDDEVHVSRDMYGTWQQDGDRLTVTFGYHNIWYDPAVTLFPAHTTFEILKLGGSGIVLSYVNDRGQRLTYTLKKWG
ncbi:MAG: lipocalin-like domain-containing protein [Muribaculaceae bacterium]|nr:lipocalin-like domain-containing protein [Muribaculaceae bacterium]